MPVLQVLVATSKHPVKGREENLTAAIKSIAKDYGGKVEAIRGELGPGCYNIAVRVSGEDSEKLEKFASVFCTLMGPISRWTTTNNVFNGFAYQGVVDEHE